MFRRISSSSIVPSDGEASPESNIDLPFEGTSSSSNNRGTINFSSPKDTMIFLSPGSTGTPLTVTMRKALQSNKILPGMDSTESQYYDTTPLNESDIRSRDDTDLVKEIDDDRPKYFAKDVSSRASRQFSTTSTIYANSTITNPDMQSIFLCLSSVIQAQICADDSLGDEEKNKYPDMNIIPDLSAECGGPVLSMTEEHMRSEANDDPLLYEMISTGRAPTVDNIYRFMGYIYSKLPNNAECSIIALIYINRMASTSKLALTMANWRAVWFISVILAYKVFDDRAMNLKQISEVLPLFDKKTLCKLELSAMKLLDFLTFVNRSIYVKYYCELRQMFSEINGTENPISIPQLTNWKAMQIEARAKQVDLSAAKHKDRVKKKLMKHKGLSKTLEDAITKNTPYVIGTCA